MGELQVVEQREYFQQRLGMFALQILVGYSMKVCEAFMNEQALTLSLT